MISSCRSYKGQQQLLQVITKFNHYTTYNGINFFLMKTVGSYETYDIQAINTENVH